MLGWGWGVLVTLFLTPYIISRIGIEKFGIWAIVGVVTGYFGLLDFGIGTSFIKYISEYYAKKDYARINQVVNTGFIFYSVFATAIIILAFFSMDFLLVAFKIPSYLYDEAFFVFFLGTILFCLSNVLVVFKSMQGGLQRMDITNKVAIALSLPLVLGTIFFLEHGYGLRGLMVNSAIIILLKGATNTIIAYRILPQLKFGLSLFDKDIFKRLFSFGYKLQISHFANLVSFQTDKLLITYFLGVGLVTFYQLGSLILQKVRRIPLLLISALIPAVSELDAREGKGPLIELFLRGSKYLIMISTPLLFFIVINASLIMLAWMGPGYEKATLTIRILALGYFAATVTGVASSITAGVARTELDMKFGILMAVLNLCLSIILIIKIGFIGAVLGTTVSLTVSSCFFIGIFHKYIASPSKAFFRLFYKPIIACIVPTFIIVVLNHVFCAQINLSRIAKVSFLGINAVIFAILYVFSILLSKYLDEFDIKLLKDKIPLLRYIL